MKPKDDVKFAEMMAVLGEAFDKPPSPTKVEIYFQALKDLSIEQIQLGATHIINNKTISTFPLVAEIREASENRIPPDAQAAVAWEKFMFALRHHCPYGSVEFDDPIIHRIIHTWGDWTTMGEWPEDDTHYWRKEFMRLYLAFLKSADTLPITRHLVGLTEYENRKRGLLDFIPKPILITSQDGQVKGIAIMDGRPELLGEQKRLTSGKGEGG